MAYNPFLNTIESATSHTVDSFNPFMMTDVESSEFVTDNPFAASNPFSDFGDYDPPAGDIMPNDLFGDPSGMGVERFDGFADDTFGSRDPDIDRVAKPKELELISSNEDLSSTTSCPLPPETQNLILSVTGQMEFTSSHLLNRIPPTRTPSPVSVRDIHSPSPTPEPEGLEEINFVDDQVLDRKKPNRPPPARPPPVMRPPPPRPAPPVSRGATPSPVPISALASQPMDDINLFDAPAPVTVKPTKEAILSLYSAPQKEAKQIDFLSDDILEDLPLDTNIESVHVAEPSVSCDELGSPSQNSSEIIVSTNGISDSPFSTSTNYATEQVTHMDCSETPANIPSTPFTTAPTSNYKDNANQIPSSVDAEKNPFENVCEGDTTYADTVTNIFSNDDDFAATKEVDIFTASSRNFDSLNEAGVVPIDAFTLSSANLLPTEETNTIDVDLFVERRAPHTADSKQSVTPEPMVQDPISESQDAFDAFSAKFESTTSDRGNTGAWGDEAVPNANPGGFEAEAFDPFLSMEAPPPPAATPRLEHQGSRDSVDDTFSVFIRPKESELSCNDTAAVPVLAPPPRPQVLPESPRFNPFDKSCAETQLPEPELEIEEGRGSVRSGGETPPTPLFDDDVSVPLEDFPRTKYLGPGWEMHLRQPNKKKITGQRFWKKIFVKLAFQGDNPVVQLSNTSADKEPFQELPLQACYSVSEIGAQQFDQFGKIFTVKLQYVFYKERPGVRPGQVTKAERITNKLSQFAAYAIQGDYQGVKEFGSDLRKLGLPVEHAPQVSQLFKLGSLSYEDMKQFSCCVEEALFRLSAHRDRALTYKMEEVQITAVDELYVEQDAEGSVLKQIARVRLFFLGFLSGMPDVELGVNDLRRQGKEVVGRHDIIPVVTEEWIRVEDTEFHACVQAEEFANSQIIKFKPPDACYIELMRFRVRPPKNRELPLQLKAVWCVAGNKVELRADVLVPGFASRKLGQVPCEDVAIRFPIPECWIYLFRVEKHFRYGSVKSAHRRTGKIKGIERFLGTVETLQESLIEVTSGQAKYEHQHRAIVWRMPRLPKEGQGAYTTHNLVCRMALTSYDQVPAELARHAFVEFTMPATQVSHMTVRSVSLQEHDGDPPEKYVRYLARHEYMVGIERTSGQAAPAYMLAATVHDSAATTPAAAPAPAPEPALLPPSSDSDSD